MKLLRTALGPLTLTVLFVLSAPQPAEALTCKAACNQVQRACIAQTKSVTKAALVDCDDARDACATTCDADPTSCQTACQDAHVACVATCPGAPDPALCQADCDAALAACPTECPNCCNAGRSACRNELKTERAQARLLCQETRSSCNTLCVEPIDERCVRSCMNDQKSCGAAAKSFERACKDSCVSGSGRRACFRACRKATAEDQEICSAQEALCIGGCIGVVTP